jgi:hypothetical protein
LTYVFLCATLPINRDKLCVLCELCVTKKELAQRATEKTQRATELSDSLTAVVLFLVFFTESTVSLIVSALVF